MNVLQKDVTVPDAFPKIGGSIRAGPIAHERRRDSLITPGDFPGVDVERISRDIVRIKEPELVTRQKRRVGKRVAMFGHVRIAGEQILFRRAALPEGVIYRCYVIGYDIE